MRPVETIIHVALYDAAILSTSTPGIGLLKPMFHGRMANSATTRVR